MVTCVAALRGCHVAAQRPSWSDSKERAGSPLEKDATTLPDFRNVPQSSTTVASIGVGQEATVAKLEPSCVKTGISLVAVHPAARGDSASGVKPCACAPDVTIRTIAICFTEPSVI